MKLKRQTFLLTETQVEKMNTLKKKIGAKTMSGVFDMALESFYNSNYKYGADPILNPTSGSSEADLIKKGIAKVKVKEAIEKEKLDLKIEPKRNICTNILGGELFFNENNKEHCKFTQYTLSGDNEQVIPIASVEDYLAETLFIPNKDVIFGERKDVKKKFIKLDHYK